MGRWNCQHAYRKKDGSLSLGCKVSKGKPDLCAHQYLCNVTGKWEVSEGSKVCKQKGRSTAND